MSEMPSTDIALFTRTLHADGVSRATLDLARGFGRHHRVDLLLLRKAGPLVADVPDGVRVVELGVNRLSKLRPAAGAVLPLVRYLRRERPRVFLPGMTSYNMAGVAAAALAGYRGHLALLEHNSPSVRTVGSPLFRATKRVATKLAYGRADTIIAVSHGAARDLERFAWLPSGRVTAIPNGIDVSAVRRLAEAPVEIAFANDGPVIVHASTLNAAKDPETLIHALARINERIRANFVILGPSERLERLAPLLDAAADLRANTILPGFVPNPYPYIARGDVFVLSSRAEGFGRVIVESTALGVPVVSTDCPSGPRELLGDGVGGTLVPVGDARALADATLEIVEASPASREARRAELKAYGDRFDIAAVADEYAKILGLAGQGAPA